MKTKLKRLMCPFLTAVILVGAIPMSAMAAGGGTTAASGKASSSVIIESGSKAVTGGAGATDDSKDKNLDFPDTSDPEYLKKTPFTDVKDTDWYGEAVRYVYKNHLFTGTSASTFSPKETMTRAMFVQVLANMTENYDAEDWVRQSSFDDVPANAWYANAVEWAYRSNIIKGTSETTFSPDKAITREEIARILYTYAVRTGSNRSYSTSAFNVFPDHDHTAPWAVTAMKWATTNGVINGTLCGYTRFLQPKAVATRAQTAQIFMNLEWVMTSHVVDPDRTGDDLDIGPTSPEKDPEEKTPVFTRDEILDKARETVSTDDDELLEDVVDALIGDTPAEEMDQDFLDQLLEDIAEIFSDYTS